LIFLWQQIPSPIITEMLCDTGDQTNGIVLDLEHGVFNPETMYTCIQVAESKHKLVFIRIPPLKYGSGIYGKIALDAAVDGIILSRVETTEQADQFVDMCAYDKGHRSQGLTRENGWSTDEMIDSRKERDSGLYLIPQIETFEAVKNLGGIMRNEFDFYLIAPYDLSANMGIPGDFDNPKFEKVISEIHATIDTKIAYHLVEDVTKEEVELCEEKCAFVALGMDSLFIKQGIENILE